MTTGNTTTKKQKPAPKKKRRRQRLLLQLASAIVVIAIFSLLVFHGPNSYMASAKHQQQIRQLKAEIQQNIDSTAYYQLKAAALDTDPETLEKIAREQYGMKRDNEDVYITQIK